MTQTLLASPGGDVVQTGPRRLECRRPGTFISVLLAVPAFGWLVGGIVLVISGALGGRVEMVASGVLTLGLSAGLLSFVRYRWRAMGNFVVDAERGVLERSRGQGPVEAWPLGAIELSLQWDAFHRGFEREYWLVARAPRGRVLRLAKGPKADVDRVLALLRGWMSNA